MLRAMDGSGTGRDGPESGLSTSASAEGGAASSWRKLGPRVQQAPAPPPPPKKIGKIREKKKKTQSHIK